MISTIAELQKYIIKGADEFGNIIQKRAFMMTTPGCDQISINYLKQKISNIPDSYTNVLRLINVYGVSIGLFNISSYCSRNTDIVDSLLVSNIEDPFFPKKFMEKHNMIQIGSYNTDLLCLTKGTAHFKEGEILFVEEGYDIYNPQDSQIHRLSKDFEQFLIVAGNLSQIHGKIHKDNSNLEEKKAEFIYILKTLGVSEEYHEAWLSVF